MSKTPQTLANHHRVHPPFHFFLVPVFLLNLIFCIVRLVRHPGINTVWAAIMAFALLVLLFLVRMNPMKVQDRVIRLEERLRLAALLPEPLRARIPELTENQLVGLRFASDAELPALTQKTLAENLTGKQIKQAIQQWRPDNWRV